MCVGGRVDRDEPPPWIYFARNCDTITTSLYLQRVSIACYAKRCNSYRKSVCPSVRPWMTMTDLERPRSRILVPIESGYETSY